MFAEFTLLLFVPSSFLVVCSAFMWGPGRSVDSRSHRPWRPGRKPEFVTGVQKGIVRQWEHGPLPEFYVWESKSSSHQALLHREEEVPGIGGPGLPCGAFPRPVFLPLTKRMFNFLQRKLASSSRAGGLGNQELALNSPAHPGNGVSACNSHPAPHWV